MIDYIEEGFPYEQPSPEPSKEVNIHREDTKKI
jgi:hypothetical protein